MDESTKLIESLGKLGLKIEEDQESRILSLLRVILRIQKTPPQPLMFSKIYDAYVLEDPDREFTKAWVHRVLKKLIDLGFVRIESPTAHRKRYTADVNSIMAALEKIRQDSIEDMEERSKKIQTELEALRLIDVGGMAQELVEFLSGKKQILESRSIRGLDEWHRITGSTIYEKAQPGDIIRTSVVEIGPFLTGVDTRMGRMFKTAAKGIETRYLVPASTFQMDEEFLEKVPKDWLQKALELLASFAKKGVPLDVRLNMSPQRSFAFVCLNDECIAFWVSENPRMGAWMTRNFNPQLIDNAIQHFDEAWKNARSMVGLSEEDLASMGASEESYLKKLMDRGEKIAELDDSTEVKEPDI